MLRSRTQTAGLASPLLFGDLAKNEPADAIAFSSGSLKFAPETVKITVHGVLSGLYLRGEYGIYNNAAGGNEIDIDAQGRVYVCTGGAVSRSDADMKTAAALIEKDEACAGVAVDPTNQQVLANSANDRIRPPR